MNSARAVKDTFLLRYSPTFVGSEKTCDKQYQRLEMPFINHIRNISRNVLNVLHNIVYLGELACCY